MSYQNDYKDEIHHLYHELCASGEHSGLTTIQAHTEAYRLVLEKYPASVVADLVHADYLIAVGKNAVAETLLNESVGKIAAAEAASMAWEKLGILQLSRGASQTALASLEIALSMRDTYGIRRMICLSLYGMGRLKDTVNQLYLMLDLYHCVDRELLMILADCHVKTEEYEDAVMVYHQVLMGDHHNMKAHEMLQQLKWRIKPGNTTDLVTLPQALPPAYITLQSFEMENNARWPHWQAVIDKMELPVVLLASDRKYRDTIEYSRRINNRTLFKIMMGARLHLTEDLFSRRYAAILELPVVIVGSHESSAIFNTPLERHLCGENTSVEDVLAEIEVIAPECLLEAELLVK